MGELKVGDIVEVTYLPWAGSRVRITSLSNLDRICGEILFLTKPQMNYNIGSTVKFSKKNVVLYKPGKKIFAEKDWGP